MRNPKPYPERSRARIKAGKILDKLHKHIMGEEEMTQTQIAAARILLAKALPDLSSVDFKGTMESKTVEQLSESELDAAIRQHLAAAAGEEKAGTGEKVSDSLH